MAVVDPNRTINGMVCEIHADVTGNWTVVEKAEEDDDALHPRKLTLATGNTIDKAIAAARVEINKRKVRVEVPFFTVDGEAGVAHGRNSRDRRILTDIGQLDSNATVLKPDTPANKVQRLREIRAQKGALHSEERALLKEYSMRLDHAVDRAVEEKQPGFVPEERQRRRRGY